MPQERRYHSATVVDKKIYVFGGQYYDPDADLHFECDNTLCEFDLEARNRNRKLQSYKIAIPSI